MVLKSAVQYDYNVHNVWLWGFQKEKQIEIKSTSWGSQLWVLRTLGGGNSYFLGRTSRPHCWG